MNWRNDIQMSEYKVITLSLAEEDIADQTDITVVAGIHYDHLEQQQVLYIESILDEMFNEIVQQYKNEKWNNKIRRTTSPIS